MTDLAQIHELQNALKELTREIAALKAAKTGSMRETQCCPSCGNRTILHFTKVTERSNAGVASMALRHESKGAFFQTLETTGALQAFACRSCGRVEWYATGLDQVEVDGEVVRLLSADPDPSAGPYR